MTIQTIPARSSVAVHLQPSQTLRITNTHGHQVVDTWAFALPFPEVSKPSDLRSSFTVEYMSMCHSRAAMNALRPSVGSTLVSNRRRPMLTLTKDTSPGVHDTLIAACDIYRYQQLISNLEDTGGYHENCSDNLHMGLKHLSEEKAGKAAGVESLLLALRGWTPDPLNLFMNIPWAPEAHGELRFEPTVSKPKDYVELRAEREVIVAMSACPQDVLKINGGNPVEVHYEVLKGTKKKR